MSEQALIVEMPTPEGGTDAILALHQALETACKDATWGEYDGWSNNMFGSGINLFFYGPDADIVLAQVAPHLVALQLPAEATLLVRYGSADDMEAEERELPLADAAKSLE